MRTFVLLLLFCGSVAGQTPGLSTVRVYNYIDLDSYPDSYGSGWLIDDDKVVTAYHVIHRKHKDKRCMVRFNDNCKTTGIVLAIDPKHDIALIWISPHPDIRKVPTDDTPESGLVAVHGYGYDFEYRYRVGMLFARVKGTRNGNDIKIESDPNGYWRAVMCSAIRGDSGGPVTINGKVIGSVLSTNDKYCVFCPIEVIREKFSDYLTPR